MIYRRICLHLKRVSLLHLTLINMGLLDELISGFTFIGLPLLRDQLGLSYEQIGLIFSVAGCSSMLLDPLLFLKRTQTPGATPAPSQPNVLLMVDTANRMQRDQDNNYRDNNVYSRTGAAYELSLNVTALNTASKYRRKYVNLVNTDTGGGSDKFTADTISIVRDQDAEFANVSTILGSISAFDARTKMNIAKMALAQAVTRNTAVARFSLMKMRQNSPAYGAAGNVERLRQLWLNGLGSDPPEDERLRQQCREHDSGSQPGTAHEGEKTRRRHYLAHVFPPEFASQNEGVRRFRYRHIANIVRSLAVVNLGSQLTFTPGIMRGSCVPCTSGGQCVAG